MYKIITLFCLCAILFLGVICYYTLKKPTVGILYIATGRYIAFWDDFYLSAEKNFLPGLEKTYYLFTDDTTKEFPKNVVKIYQKQERWPHIVMHRYGFFDSISNQLKKHDYLFQINANVNIQNVVGSEILPNRKQRLMFIHHPSYFGGFVNKFPYERGISLASVKWGEGCFYLFGAFTGGRSKDFLKMSKEIALWSKIDMSKNRIPIWHDESYINRYFIDLENKGIFPLVLDPNYLMPEEAVSNNLAYKNINHLKEDVKILLKDKREHGGHGWLRSVE